MRAWLIGTAASLTIGVLAPCIAYAVDNAATRAISSKTAGKATLHRDVNGRVTHLRSATAPLAVVPTLNSDARARTILKQYRDAFLDPSTPLDLVTTRVAPVDTSGRSHVRYQQRVNGIPVRGGNVIVHLDSRGVTAVHSKLQSDLDGVATTPVIDATQALTTAEHSIGKLFLKSRLSFTTPRLEIVNPDQLRGKNDGESHLAWFTEVRAAGVREFVWIDAQRGDLLLHFSQVAHALEVSDFAGACSDVLINTPNYTADNPPPTGSEAETALNYLGDANNFFSSSFSYTGIDGTGTVSVTAGVNICDADPAYESSNLKAAWAAPNMYFATGFATVDDIVGHEYTHAVIDNKSGLLLGQPQSGALAEGFADIFGEVIDQLQSVANDSGDTKWAFGEDASGGALRNLMNPGDKSLPGKVTDTNFYCGNDSSIGIHRNGAVISHAFALLADGGTYNGFTITGIGVQKAARIFFDTMTQHLTENSSFHDAYIGFKDAAKLLEGTQLTSSDLAQLYKVLDAVELDAPPCSTQLNYCPTGQTAVSIFSDDFENTSSNKWTNGVTTGFNHWNTGIGTPAIYVAAEPLVGANPITGEIVGLTPFRGTYALRADNGVGTFMNHAGDSYVSMAAAASIPSTASARMQFEGRFFWEQLSGDGIGPDGGTIEYSTNSGATWQNVAPLISAGQGYTGVIQGDGDPPNPLGLQPAFVGSTPSGGYSSTQIDLTTLAGQSVQFRFRVGTDNGGTSGLGWQIDDVNIYTCTDAALVVSPTEGLTTSESGGSTSFTVRLGSAPSESVTLKIESSNTSEGTVSAAELVFDSSNYNQEQSITISGVDDGVSDGDTVYTVTVSVDQTNDSGYLGTQSVPVSVTNTTSSKKKGGGGADLTLLLVMLLLVMAHRVVVGHRRSPAIRE